MNGIMKVEFVIRLGQIGKVPDWIQNVFSQFSAFQSRTRYVADVPADWTGFWDGTVIKILEALNESVFIALAYLTEDEGETVTDLEGKAVDRFPESIEGRKCFKYVKKKLRIVKEIGEDVFTVEGYALNLDYTEPVVKILDVYANGKESGLSLNDFYQRK